MNCWNIERISRCMSAVSSRRRSELAVCMSALVGSWSTLAVRRFNSDEVADWAAERD